MANLVAAQTNLNFDFRQLNKMGPYPVLILSRPLTNNRLEIGSLYRNIPTTDVIELELDSGRTGSPSLDITITRPNPQGGQSLSATIVYEPGVHAGNDVDSKPRYNLQTFGPQWQGRSGGGGHMYANDPALVGGLSIEVKRNLLKAGIITHGYMARDPSVLTALRSSLPPGDPLRVLLNDMTSPTWTASLYVIIPLHDEPRIQRPVIEPLYAMCRGSYRPSRYHPYTQPRNVLTFEMARLPGFRNSMFCDLIVNQQNQQVFGAPTRQIMDVVGCKEAYSHAIGYGVGLIRETQGHEEFCEDLGKSRQSIRLVRTQIPVHSKATRTFGGTESATMIPSDPLAYLGLVRIDRTSRTFPITAPKPGAIFLVQLLVRDTEQKWVPATHTCHGTVLHSHDAISAAGADFAMMLQMPVSIRGLASQDLDSARQGGVLLSYVSNRGSQQIELDALRGFGNNLRGSATILRNKVCAQQLVTPALSDIRGGPQNSMAAMYTGAVSWAKQNQLVDTHDRNQCDLLDVIPATIDRQSTLIRTSMRSGRFSAMRLAMLMLIAVHHRIVFVVDEPNDQAQLAYHLFHDLRRMNSIAMSTQLHGRMSHVRIVRYSSVDVHFDPSPADDPINLSDTRNRTRPIADLEQKFILDDLPDESYLFDDGTYQNAADAAPPPDTTPSSFSMGDEIGDYLSTHLAERGQYYLDRARVLDGVSTMGFEEAAATLQRRRNLVRNVLSRIGILICDNATAVSDDVVMAMNGSILMLGNAHRVNFSRANAVLLRHDKHPAAYILGDPEDTHHGVVPYTAQDRSEARTIFARPLWEVLRIAGNGSLDLS